ncbi:lipoprotein, partial [Mesoplasma seiffertii]|uniref:lipoprotein n=1 Tax=Mesoplasma seiffertii TaxID=28224 RepID=UPI000479F65C
MKKLLGLLGSVTLVATSVSTAAACSNKLKKVDLTNYLELVSKETYQKHLSIEQAIKSIQAIEQLPAGVSKVDVSKASDDEIKLTFTTAKDYAKVDSLVVKFVPAKVTRITSFNDQAKSLAEYSFKTIKEARDAIATLAPPEGVSSFTATIIDNKIVVTFKMKEGYLPISNQVFQFIAIRDVDTSAFRTKVNEIVNGQFKTVGEAITKINAL